MRLDPPAVRGSQVYLQGPIEFASVEDAIKITNVFNGACIYDDAAEISFLHSGMKSVNNNILTQSR